MHSMHLHEASPVTLPTLLTSLPLSTRSPLAEAVAAGPNVLLYQENKTQSKNGNSLARGADPFLPTESRLQPRGANQPCHLLAYVTEQSKGASP